MTTASLSGAPSWAVTIWSDDNYIYVELPVKGEAPYITKHAFTEGGLSKVLHTLRMARAKAPPSVVSTFEKRIAKTLIAQPLIKKGKPKPATTESQRDNARAVLRKLGLTGK